ncbi:MAG: hypothetical protein LIP03_12900 [Bacteroidales bacterium]|nr:hypothetical protein [Bacteroidales bacterium]
MTINKTSNVTLSNMSIIIAIIIMLMSANPWFAWNMKPVQFIFIGLFAICRVALYKKNIKTLSKSTFFAILVLILLTVQMCLVNLSNINASIGAFLNLFVGVFFVIQMSIAEKIKLRDWMINVLAVIVLISGIAFLIHLIGIKLPYTLLENHNSFYQYKFQNYYFFITTPIAYRFQSIFTEPGHLGMLCALFLYIDEYQFKKKRDILLLLGLIFSFSFAGYLLLLIGYLTYTLIKKRSFKILIISCLTTLLIGWIIDMQIKTPNGNGIITERFLNRIELDEAKGLAGNNRTNTAYDKLFKETLESGQIVWGMLGSDNLTFENLRKKGGNSGYKVFLMEYGLIGFILLLLFFFLIIKANPSKLGYGMYLIFFLSFLQRNYWTWEIQSFMYICSATYFYVQNGSCAKVRG